MTASGVFGRGFGEKRISIILKGEPNIITEDTSKDEKINELKQAKYDEPESQLQSQLKGTKGSKRCTHRLDRSVNCYLLRRQRQTIHSRKPVRTS